VLLEPPEVDEPDPEPPALVPPVAEVEVLGEDVDGVLVALLAGAAVVVLLLLLPHPLQAKPKAATARTAAKLIERFICTSFSGAWQRA
jgi:hypothetical protein